MVPNVSKTKANATPRFDSLASVWSTELESRIADSGLPHTAQQKITDVVQFTRLWRIEKSQIADELIAHFSDGQQRGQDAETMLSKFGETKTIALMMRAAKKRNRSMAWKAIVAGGYSFIAFLIFYAGLAVWYFSGKPNPSVDYYAVVSETANAVPEDQRAWPVYRDAWIEHDLVRLRIPKLVGQAQGEGWNTWRPGDEKWSNVVAFLEDHQSLIEAIRRGGQLSGFGLASKREHDYSEQDRLALYGAEASKESVSDESDGTPLLDDALIAALLIQVQEMRKMARILETDAFRMAESGDAALVAKNIQAMLGFGPQAAELPFLVSALVGLAVDGIAYNTIEELLSKYPNLLDDQQLAAIFRKIEQLSPRDLLTLKGERAFQKDLIQRMYSDDGNGDGRLTNEGLAALPMILNMTSTNSTAERTKALIHLVGPGVALISGSRKQAESALDAVMDEYETLIRSPVYQMPVSDVQDFEQLVAKHAPNDIGTSYFMRLLLPAIEQVRMAGERTEGRRNGVLLALATHRFRFKHQRFPESAEELMPDFLQAIPIDVMTGDRLKYRLSDGQPLIFSVGADGDDDSGKPAVDSRGDLLYGNQHFHAAASQCYDGDWVLWPSPKDE